MVTGNVGLICLHRTPHIWLKAQSASTRYLIGEIQQAGGSFTHEVGYIIARIPNCGVGGSNYQGGLPFVSSEQAIRYLKRYFEVTACGNNSLWTQGNIDKL